MFNPFYEKAIDKLGVVVVAALAVAIGARDDELNDLFDLVGDMEVPDSSAEIVAQFRKALVQLREKQ